MKRYPALGAALLLLAACSTTPPVDGPRPPVGPGTPLPPGIEEPPAPGTPEARNRIDPPEPMPAAESAFRWPARGTVVERRATGGIGVRASGDVTAVKSGVVRVLLSDWAGRRNLIIIRHADGFLSEYSDVDEILVPAGKAVRQGQAIARLKAGGILQFRLYREKQALDPTLYLP
jgi:lipoprotein NlpD